MENIDTTPLDAVIAISPEKLKELEMLGALDPETDGEVLGYVQSETDFDEVKPN